MIAPPYWCYFEVGKILLESQFVASLSRKTKSICALLKLSYKAT